MSKRAIRPPQFTIASALWVTTYTALCLALLRYAPCLGVAALVISTPAVLFLFCVGSAYQMDGRPLSIAERLNLFGIALAVSALALVTGFTVCMLLAFFLVAVGGAIGVPYAGPVGITSAASLGLATTAAVLWQFVRLIRSS